MSPKVDVSFKRKAQIIHAAMTVFSKKGIHARLEEVAAEAKLSKATIYLYFESKEKLTEVVLSSLFSSSIADLESIADLKGDTSHRLHQIADDMASVMERMEDMFPMFFETLAYGLRNPDSTIPVVLKRYVARGMEAMDLILQEGVERGDLKPVDTRQLAIAISAGMEGMVVLSTYDKEMINIREQFHDFIDMVLSGHLKEH